MFNKLFSKYKSNKTTTESESVDQATKEYLSLFQFLVSSSLEKSGVDSNCEFSKSTNWSDEKEDKHNNILNKLDYDALFDKVVLEELEQYKKTYANPSKSVFIDNFYFVFHHIKIANHTPDFIQQRNNKILSAYNNMLECIKRIQGWMDNEKVRLLIESDFRKSPHHLSIIYQATTPFCIISLGCDQIGRYSIVYTLDYRIKDIIGGDFASTFIRRIYQFTSGDMEAFLKFSSLNGDCIKTLEEIIQLAKVENNHKVSQIARFNEKSINNALNKITLRDDLDDETKNWFNK